MLKRLKLIIFALVVVIPVSLILFLLILSITISLYVMDLPRKIGEVVSFDSAIRSIIFRISNPDEMRRFRDDVLHIIESENKDSGTDRWGLLREMDEAKVEIEEKLQNGEFAFSFVGTISALLIGNVFGIVFGSVIITVVALIVSFLVSARIIVTDVLCYESIEHRNEPIERLEVYHAWNTKAALKRGAVGIAILTAFASRSKQGYRLGIRFLEIITYGLYSEEGKWQVE